MDGAMIKWKQHLCVSLIKDIDSAMHISSVLKRSDVTLMHVAVAENIFNLIDEQYWEKSKSEGNNLSWGLVYYQLNGIEFWPLSIEDSHPKSPYKKHTHIRAQATP